MDATRLLRRDQGICAALSYYGPGYRMQDHAHNKTQFSFILSGHLTEDSSKGRYTLPSGSLLVKPSGFEHANTVGTNGCLVLGLNYQDTHPDWDYALQVDGTSSEVGRRYWHAVREFAFGLGQQSELLFQLSALAGIAAPKAESCPQFSVTATNARESSRAQAARAGVHPVHFARLFRKKNGQSPRTFKKSEQAAAALQDVLFGQQRLADIAYLHDFADQAHMSRTIKAVTGFTPRGLRQVFANS